MDSKTVTDHLAMLSAARLRHEERIRELQEKLETLSGFDRRKLEARVRNRLIRIDEIDRRAARLRGDG